MLPHSVPHISTFWIQAHFSNILTPVSFNLLPFFRVIFTHNETDSFYNYGCTVLLQSISAEGDFGSARWVWGRRTCVIHSQWFKWLKFFFSYLIDPVWLEVAVECDVHHNNKSQRTIIRKHASLIIRKMCVTQIWSSTTNNKNEKNLVTLLSFF